jgi:hypothetical protein
MRLLASVVATFSADSSTNTTPLEFANPTGFTPIASLDDLGYFARQRMEFVKRLYSQKHGIYRKSSAPVGGKVHVVGVGRDGEIRKYSKIRY